jgi:hypothetical protein
LTDEPTLHDSSPAGSAGQTGNAGQQTAGSTAGGPQTGQGSQAGGSGQSGTPGTTGASSGYGATSGLPTGYGGSGPLTPAEQVAILDAQLEKGASEFDAMIIKTEAEQRATARASARQQASVPSASESGTGGGYGNGSGNSPYEEGMADAGGYSTGGGLGGAGGGAPPPDSAKFPAPADIPSGSDDDVVARQLREAASREPDPAVRAKLWDEYRKYKGIQ